MFAHSIVSEESKRTYVRTHVQTGLRFVYQTRGLQSFSTEGRTAEFLKIFNFLNFLLNF